jgi:hypothetical protein
MHRARCAAILQLLPGNMGRPGGGILALLGHAWGSKRPKNQRLEWVAVVCFQAFASIFNIWPTSD